MPTRTDNFNRADGDLNGSTPSDAGAAWTSSGANVFQVSSNQCISSGGGTKYAYLEASAADVDIECTFVSVNASNQGLLARFVDASNYWFLYVLNNYFHLCKRVAGSNTDPVASFDSQTFSASDVIKIRASGSSWTVYVNGVSKFTTTDAAHNTATKHGLYNDAGGGMQVDAFSITPVVVTSLTADRDNVLCGSGTVVISLVGVGTSWAGSPFSLSGAPTGWSIASQNVTSTTTATVTLNKGSGTGAFTVADGTLSDTLTATNTAAAVATGNWGTAATWDVIESPTSGNHATNTGGYTVTIAATASIGSSPSDTTTNVLTATGTGGYTVADGVTFTVKGNVSIDNGTLQIGTGSTGGAILEFSAASAGTPATRYQCVIGGNTKTSSKFMARGISSSPAQLRSNAGGGNAQVVVTDGQYDVQYLTLTRMGDNDDTHDSLNLAFTTPGTPTHTFTSMIVNAGCGRVRVAGSMGAGIGLDLTNCTFKELTGANFKMTGSATTPTATRRIRGCVFLGPVELSPEGMTIGGSTAADETFFLGGCPSYASANAKAAAVTNCFFRHVGVSSQYRLGDWDECVIVCDASTYDGNGRYSAKASPANVHWTTPTAGPAGTYAVSNSMCESFGMDSDAHLLDDADGDFDYGPDATHNSAFSRFIMVPQDRDSSPVPTSPACLATNMAGTGSTYEHCTHFNGGQGFIALCESTDGTTGQITSLKSNLVWNESAYLTAAYNAICYIDNPAYAADLSTFPTDDVVASGAGDYNGFWQGNEAKNYAGEAGYYYKRSGGATVPGAHDVRGQDPQFVNKNVRFWRWVKQLNGGSSTIPAPASGGSTLDVANDGYMGGTTAGNGSPPTTGWRDYCAWGIYKLSLKNEPTHADYDAAYTLAAYKAYIRAGHAPTNSAYRTAAHDGTTIGAVEGVSNNASGGGFGGAWPWKRYTRPKGFAPGLAR